MLRADLLSDNLERGAHLFLIFIPFPGSTDLPSSLASGPAYFFLSVGSDVPPGENLEEGQRNSWSGSGLNQVELK